MISPDPVPPPPWPRAEIVTTEGRTWSATEVTSHTLAVMGADVAAGVEADDFVAATMTPPITRPTTSAVPSAAHGSHRRLFCPCLDAFTATQSSTAAARPASPGRGEAGVPGRSPGRAGRGPGRADAGR